MGTFKMACPEGIEPPTHSLEGCCSIQLSYGQSKIQDPQTKSPRKHDVGEATDCVLYLVGVQGFEPWTPWSQTRCATRLRHTPK